MGSVYSYLNHTADDDSPTLPTAIKEDDLMKNKVESIQEFRKNYRNLGFVVVEMKDDFNSSAKLYRSLCSEWFGNNSLNEKSKFSTKYEDSESKEFGIKPHIGYILTPSVKEYIRLKKNTDKSLFPSIEIYNLYHKLFDRWNTFTNKCIDIVFDEIVNVFDNKTQKYNLEPILNKQEKQEIVERNLNYSSLSVIHYFDNICAKQKNKNESELESKDDEDFNDKYNQRTKEIPLDKHQDTGVMTFILCSDVCGLQIFDRKTNKYIDVENYYDSNQCMFVISGRKMEHIFSWKKIIPATWHYVKIPVEKERFSLLYFLEIQKDW